jgi:peptidoglycan/LPS O-acetylase OafA/YrhL
MITIADRLRTTNSRSSGFDYMRIILALSVIALHTILVCDGRAAETALWTGAFRPVALFIVPSFFALSGFLVAGSLERNDLPAFLTLRALRIFPALAVEVVVSAVLIGPLLTSLPLVQYFQSPLFSEYFQNMLGRIHYLLPGVFEHLPGGASVNLQLWTVPFELECYLALSLLALLGLHRRPRLLLALLVAFCLGTFATQAIAGRFWPLDDRPPGRMIVICFLFGASLYALRDRLPCTAAPFALSLVLTWFCLTFPQAVFLAPLPVAYLTVYLGLLNPPRTRILRGADYSYGLYLYGFPVQQTISFLFPAYRIWYVNFAASLIACGCLAFLSWHLIEGRVMARRGNVLAVVAGFRNAVLTVWGRIRTGAASAEATLSPDQNGEAQAESKTG